KDDGDVDGSKEKKIWMTRMTRSLSKNLITSYENPEQKFRSSRKLIRTRSLDRLDSPESNLFSNYVDQFEEEETETMRGPTMEEYMTKTRDDYGSGIVMHKIDDKALFKLKHQFLKELQDNTFSGSDNENSNEHTKKLLEIVDLFHIPEVTQDQIMLRVFPMSLTGAASRWLRNEPTSSIDTWEILKKKFLSKYCPSA
ncbi:putative reverse transcriptase domain-containing protein, partial [Tanacetum coccineum]